MVWQEHKIYHLIRTTDLSETGFYEYYIYIHGAAVAFLYPYILIPTSLTTDVTDITRLLEGFHYVYMYPLCDFILKWDMVMISNM